jgi:hypothetical protein
MTITRSTGEHLPGQPHLGGVKPASVLGDDQVVDRHDQRPPEAGQPAHRRGTEAMGVDDLGVAADPAELTSGAQQTIRPLGRRDVDLGIETAEPVHHPGRARHPHRPAPLFQRVGQHGDMLADAPRGWPEHQQHATGAHDQPRSVAPIVLTARPGVGPPIPHHSTRKVATTTPPVTPDPSAATDQPAPTNSWATIHPNAVAPAAAARRRPNCAPRRASGESRATPRRYNNTASTAAPNV